MSDTAQIDIDIRPWSQGDLPLLERLMGDPAMTGHLGGVETAEKIRQRHERYCQSSASGENPMFVILAGPQGAAAGSIGYWEKAWQDQQVWETGWSVLPEFQGQGVATQAARIIVERARAAGKHRFLHAFPAVDNGPSNAICRKAGFTFQGAFDFEYPPGHPLRCNDWRLDLFASDASVSAPWRIGLRIIGAALIPAFLLGALLTTLFVQFTPLARLIQVAILAMPVLYWLLYFKRLEVAWVRYLLLITGLICLLLCGLVSTFLIVIFRNYH